MRNSISELIHETIKRQDKIIKEEIRKVIEEEIEINYGIKIYHRSGMHSPLPIDKIIPSICKNGLLVSTATDGDGIGKCIWFTKDFNSYGKNGLFVVSMILTREKMEKYHIDFDNTNAYAYRDIPFSELTIEKIPMFYTTLGGGNFLTNLQKPKNFNTYFDFFIKCATNHKQFKFIIYVDAWDYFGEEYDLETIAQMDNIEIERIMQ